MDVHFVSFDVVFNVEFERKFYPLPTLLWWLRSNVANVQVELALSLRDRLGLPEEV